MSTTSCGSPLSTLINAISPFRTPQAADDNFTVLEGSGSLFLFDVMANDGGGAGKSLYSIAAGTESQVTLGTFLDLITKDANGTITAGNLTGFSDYSTLGAKVAIVNGKIAYSTAGTALAGMVDALAAGQTLTDTITYAIRLANGLLSFATMTVTLTGTNDGPVVSAATAGGAVAEDGVASASGSIAFSDADAADNHTVSIVAAPPGALGVLNLAVSEAANAVNGTVNWTYNLNNAAAQSLAQGETRTETFTIRISDGNGGSVDKAIVISITGTNDAPAITSGAQAGGVAEDGALTATGQVTAADVDNGAVLAYAGNATGVYGGFAVDAGTGAWTYTLDNAAHQALAEGESHTETFTVTVTDQFGAAVTQDVVITVTGTNDAPAVTAFTATAGEDGPVFSQDLLAGASDADNGAVLSITDLPASLTTADGRVLSLGVHYTLTGSTFALTAAGFALFNGLEAGDTDTLTVSFSVSDGIAPVANSLTLTIDGAADIVTASLPAVFAGADPNDSDGLVGFTTVGFTLISGSGTINGDDTPNIINGSAAIDTINALGSGDRVYAGGGGDTVNGGDGNDLIYGQAGDDTISGDAGLDLIYGGSGADTITGGTENDTIYGGSGNDTIDGGGGDDNIIGGYGADTINVATGQDLITYRSNLDTGDTINGFGGANGPGGDVVNMAQMDANTANGSATNEAFAWGGQKSAAIVEAFSVTWYQDAGGVRILADTDGNLVTAEFTILLSGIAAVGASDFFL